MVELSSVPLEALLIVVGGWSSCSAARAVGVTDELLCLLLDSVPSTRHRCVQVLQLCRGLLCDNLHLHVISTLCQSRDLYKIIFFVRYEVAFISRFSKGLLQNCAYQDEFAG